MDGIALSCEARGNVPWRVMPNGWPRYPVLRGGPPSIIVREHG
jgi:hypothetical protein